MKNFAAFALTLCLFASFGCKKDKEEEISDCMKDKIEEFKQTQYAESIIQINAPQGTLYWFVEVTVDGGEDVMNNDCEVVCQADCFCGPGANVCSDALFNNPMETIWEK